MTRKLKIRKLVRFGRLAIIGLCLHTFGHNAFDFGRRDPGESGIESPPFSPTTNDLWKVK